MGPGILLRNCRGRAVRPSARGGTIKTARKIESQVEGLICKLTLEEKIGLLSGRDLWRTVPVERLGIPSIVMTDGPHGVRACNPETGRRVGPATAFPSGISMGAAWNPRLIEQVGQALGEETRGMDCDILLGPCVNIVRHPLGGRNFETYSEDPFLAGRTAVGFIRGVQSRGVGTSLKHFALNNYEIERMRASTRVDERTIREIYLPQFEMAVKEAQPWTVMCSYNRINGTYASQHDRLLNEILRDEWGYEGAVISDWGANHTIFESIQGGLDLEMPGPARYYELLREAVLNWQIEEALVDQAARRVLRLVLLSGRMEKKGSAGAVNTRAHQVLARRLAEEAITLLKNESNALPLSGIKSLAVIGPNAVEAVIEGGGSSRVPPPYRVSPLEGLRSRLGRRVNLVYEPGCDNFDQPMNVPHAWLADGLNGEFFAREDFSGQPLFAQERMGTEFWYHIGWVDTVEKPAAVRWTGRLSVPQDGAYQFALKHVGAVRLFVDGKQVLEAAPRTPAWQDEAGTSSMVRLQAGKVHELRIDYVRPVDHEVIAFNLGIGLSFSIRPGPAPRSRRRGRPGLRWCRDLCRLPGGLRDRGHRPAVDAPEREAGRADCGRCPGQPAHGGSLEHRCTGGHAVARQGGSCRGSLLPWPGERQRSGGGPARRGQSIREAAGHLSRPAGGQPGSPEQLLSGLPGGGLRGGDLRRLPPL